MWTPQLCSEQSTSFLNFKIVLNWNNLFLVLSTKRNKQLLLITTVMMKYFNILTRFSIVLLLIDVFTECPELTAPDNGQVTHTGFTPGDTAHFVCDNRFTLVGDVTRTCLEGSTWTGESPQCLESKYNNFSLVRWLRLYFSKKALACWVRKLV